MIWRFITKKLKFISMSNIASTDQTAGAII